MGLDQSFDVWNGFSKPQLLRIIMQLLRDMGYRRSFEVLQEESSCSYQDAQTNELESFVLSGNLYDAKGVLGRFQFDESVFNACRFLISQQIFFEALYNNNFDEALKVLRGLVSLENFHLEHMSLEAFDEDSRQRVHQCSTLMVYPSKSLKSELNWSHENSREKLWKHIQCLISPTVTIPPNRLLTLLRQAVELQELHCLNHYDSGDECAVFPLLFDHCCTTSKLPSRLLARLESHTDEIWDVSISPDGQFFATASKDESVILWSASYPFEVIYRWKVHRNVVSCVSWSSDSKLLASCGNDGLIVIWSPYCEEFLQKIEPHTAVATSVAWIPNTWKFITAGMDKQMILHEVVYNPENTPSSSSEHSNTTPLTNGQSNSVTLNGTSVDADTTNASVDSKYTINSICKWSFESRIRTLSINLDGTLAVFATVDRMLRVWDLVSGKEIVPIPESAAITTVTCSKLFNQVLVSVAGQRPVMRLWDIDERRIIQTYRGHREDRYVLRSTLGGPMESFVVSGSEDAQIYIWNKIFGSLLSVIAAHSSTVNAVAWSNDHLISVSDDQTIAIWEPDHNE
uniref:WD domain, G-beta repeat, putative n=1 Tax=Theileria annulata TaxID=5874 RepID=A0A3B0NG95_THEAN